MINIQTCLIRRRVVLKKEAGFEDNLNLALNASAFDRLLLQDFQFSSEIFDILDSDNGANFHFHFLFRI